MKQPCAGPGGLLALVATLVLASASFAVSPDPVILPLSALDRENLDYQRDLVKELARRHVGTRISGGSRSDLRVLQRLVDRQPRRDRRLDAFASRTVMRQDQIFELQSIGVVLGDVMASQLGLHWVVFEDPFGRGRALRYEQTDFLLFPTTMVSKRFEKGLPVDVEALFRGAEEEVAEQKRPKGRWKPPPRPKTSD